MLVSGCVTPSSQLHPTRIVTVSGMAMGQTVADWLSWAQSLASMRKISCCGEGDSQSQEKKDEGEEV